jgi:hypothetical protein
MINLIIFISQICVFLDLRVPLVLVCCCRHFLRPFSPLQVRARRGWQKSSLLHKLSCYYYQFYSWPFFVIICFYSVFCAFGFDQIRNGFYT